MEKKVGRNWLLIALIALISFGVNMPLDAQCAMCKAVAETSQEGGSSVATGLNSGILYLMAFPYLILSAIGIAFYYHRKKNREEAAS